MDFELSTEQQRLERELYDYLLQNPSQRLQLRMDEDVPYRLVRKVIFTAQQAGIENLTLVGVSRSSM